MVEKKMCVLTFLPCPDFSDIRHVQDFLGHADLDTTKTYLRLVPGHLKEDYEKAMPELVASAI
jgi:site-specific recombinase XerC